MWRLPSSLTLTATFFRVLLPQWGQKTLVMSDVVLQDTDREGLLLPGRWNTDSAHERDHPARPSKHRTPSRGQRRSAHTCSLEAAVAAEDVAPGLADQHAVHRQHVEAHLQQHVLQRGERNRDAVSWDCQEL